MKSIIKLSFLISFFLISNSISAQISYKDSASFTDKEIVRKTNLRLNNVKSGMMFGGAFVVAGAVFNIVAINKNFPESKNYPTITEYENAVLKYNNNQKGLKSTSVYLTAAGGLAMMISGFGIATIKLKQTSQNKISLKTNLLNFGICYQY